jgi:hypothetical protein
VVSLILGTYVIIWLKTQNEAKIMSKKIVRLQIQKDQVNPASLPTLLSDIRNLIQEVLFEFLREINDTCEKALKSLSVQEVTDIRSRYPETQAWKNPSDEEIRLLIQNQESADEPGRGGWMYGVREEELCVNGVLRIYLVGHKSKLPVSKLMRFDDFPGLLVWEEVTND